MAPVSKHCISIAKFSSQDPLNKAENILRKDAGKWLSHTDDHSTRIEAEIHLNKAIKIGFINVGNAGSAFIELLVGSSMWPSGKDYITLLPSTMLMSPVDSKLGKNNSGVKMFDEGVFAKGVADDEWDRLRVICRQPFAKRAQFGLQFVDIIEDDKLRNSETADELKTSPDQSLAAFRKKLQVRSPDTSPRLSSPSSSNFSSPPSSRAAGLVRAALSGHVKPKQQASDGQKHPRKHQRHSDKVKRSAPYQDGVAGMTKNHFICNMVEMLSIQHQDTCISCSHCQQPSVGRCVSCELFMCEKCLKPHNDYPGFSDHVVLTIEELSKPENQWKIKGKSYCKKHSSKKLKLYCETCEELICTYCVVFEHVRPDHICSPLEEIAGRKREELKTACQSLEINECSETQDLCSKLESTSHNLNQDLEEVKRKIHERKNEVLAEVKNILEREVTSLIHEEAIHAVRKQDEIDEELKRISEHKAGQRKVYDTAMALVDNGSNEQIMLSHKSVKQSVENSTKKYERAAKIEYQFSEYGDEELDNLFCQKIVTVDAQLQRRKTLSRRTAGDIEDEVECFLETFDFDKLPMEKVTYRHLKDEMEELRGCLLTKPERKIFMRLAEKHVLEVLDRRKDLQKLEENPAVNGLASPSSTKTSPTRTPIPKSSSPPNTSPVSPPTLPESVDPPTTSSPLPADSLHECPICEGFFPRDTIEFHASTCVGASTCETVAMTCLARDSDVKEIQTTAIYSPVKSCVVKGDSSEIVCCPVCNRWFSESRIMVHVNVCADTQGLASC